MSTKEQELRNALDETLERVSYARTMLCEDAFKNAEEAATLLGHVLLKGGRALRHARQAPRTPAVSVDGEKAAEEYLLNNGGYRPSDGDCFTVRKNIFLAGFQARAPLVELMREAKEVMARAYRLSVDHHDFKLYAMEPFEKVIDRIDAALKGEK